MKILIPHLLLLLILASIAQTEATSEYPNQIPISSQQRVLLKKLSTSENQKDTTLPQMMMDPIKEESAKIIREYLLPTKVIPSLSSSSLLEIGTSKESFRTSPEAISKNSETATINNSCQEERPPTCDPLITRKEAMTYALEISQAALQRATELMNLLEAHCNH